MQRQIREECHLHSSRHHQRFPKAVTWRIRVLGRGWRQSTTRGYHNSNMLNWSSPRWVSSHTPNSHVPLTSLHQQSLYHKFSKYSRENLIMVDGLRIINFWRCLRRCIGWSVTGWGFSLRRWCLITIWGGKYFRGRGLIRCWG